MGALSSPAMTAQAPLSHEAVWRRYDALEARLTAHLSERMLDLAGLSPEKAPGMRVLDLATGRGEPALRAAHRVGPTGHVLGLELSDALLAMAREAAAREGLGAQLELRAQDAQQLDGLPSASFDAATCRWGLMYMPDPVAALAGTRRALRAGAPLVAALWSEPDRVPYHTLPRRVLERITGTELVRPADPEAPGVFRLGDLPRIQRDWARAGLTITHVEELDLPVFEDPDPAEVVAWCRAFGLARLLQDQPESTQRAWEADMTAAAEGLRDPDGLIRLGGVTRIVVAR